MIRIHLRKGGNPLSVTEAAHLLGVSRQRVAQYCQQGRIDGAYQVGQRGTWVIPDGFEVKRGRLCGQS